MNRLVRVLFLFVFIVPCLSFAQVAGSSQIQAKVVISYKDTSHLNFLHDPALHNEGWDTLPQTKFWKQVVNLTGDTCIINVASCRQPLQKVCQGDWRQLSESDKKFMKDSLSCVNNLDENSTLFVTSGKSEFYELKTMMPDITKAIKVFEQNGVDPWYAQTIMLIESPGKTKVKSSVGANGSFQLMRSVAKKYGLVVNKKRDDRTNLEKSAMAASKLLKSSCIPYIKQYLTELNIPYNETDLWFRLLVLHAYHAGAGNVHCALTKMQPKAGGVALFNQLWQTECGGFKNESQNYSQIALASLSNFDEMIQADGDTIFLVKGDRMFKKYVRSAYKPWDAFQYLNQCLMVYENDLVDGTVPYEYFLKRVSQIRKELKLLAKHVTKDTENLAIYSYPAPELQILSLANRLITKQRYDEAISLIKMDAEARPNSAEAYALLAKAYSQNGNKQMASLYASKSLLTKENPVVNKD